VANALLGTHIYYNSTLCFPTWPNMIPITYLSENTLHLHYKCLIFNAVYLGSHIKFKRALREKNSRNPTHVTASGTRHSHLSWRPERLRFNEYKESLLREGRKPQSSADVKNEWRHTAIPPRNDLFKVLKRAKFHQRDNKSYSLRQCFSTSVRPRPGKLFFHRTRARPQQIYTSVPFQIFLSSYIKLT